MKIRDLGFLLLGGFVTLVLLYFSWGKSTADSGKTLYSRSESQMGEAQDPAYNYSKPPMLKRLSELLCSDDVHLGLPHKSILHQFTANSAADLFEVTLHRKTISALVAFPGASEPAKPGTGQQAPDRRLEPPEESLFEAGNSPQLYLFRNEELVAALEENWLDQQEYESLVADLTEEFGERSSFPPRQPRSHAEDLNYFNDSGTEGLNKAELYLNRQDMVARNAWKHLAPDSHFWYDRENSSTVFIIPLHGSGAESKGIARVLVGTFNDSGLTCVSECISVYKSFWLENEGHSVFSTF